MKHIPRIYDSMVSWHLQVYRQMIFLSGPRQVGKTTVGKSIATDYLNWDNQAHRLLILGGPEKVAHALRLEQPHEKIPVVVFDEIHRYPRWKTFLKGFFDVYGGRVKIIVTGSSRLDVFKRGGDSLMGRYFPYRMHPLSVGELLRQNVPASEVSPPRKLSEPLWNALMKMGGFPEPFALKNPKFLKRWRMLRRQQLIRGDIRDTTRIRELEQMDSLVTLLESRTGGQVVYASLANELQVSENTIRQWIATLNSFHLGFSVRPWSKNISNSIRKMPKWYPLDWSNISDEGSRNETFMACHLHKAVETWTDVGLGDFELHYIRDKQKCEIDFLVTKDKSPWLLVEAKTTDTALSPTLAIMQRATGAPVALQVVFNLPFRKVDCFSFSTPVVVPAKTFLSQLP